MSKSQNGGTHRLQSVPVPLLKPIKAHGRDASELALRPLTGKDLRICGAPFKVGMRGEECGHRGRFRYYTEVY